MNDQPRLAAGAIDTYFFSAKFANVVDLIPRYPNVGHEVVPTAERDNIRALGMAWEQTCRRARGHMHVAGNKRLVRRRRAIDSDRLDRQPFFLKKPLSLATRTGKAAVGNNGMATRIFS